MARKITILGAGLVGSLLAVLLQKRGFQVSLFERRSDMRKANLSAGRSINLAMSVRGWKGLELAGLREAIEEIAIPMYGRKIHNLDGTSPFQAYGKNNEAIYSVSRGELNRKLMTLAEESGAKLFFEHRATDVDIKKNSVTFETPQGEFIHTDHEIIISADGAFSALRNAYMKTDRFNYNQFYIEHGYKELSIPPDAAGQFKLEKEVLHIWPRKNFMMIALPNIDGTFTCTLFFPFEGTPSFDSVRTNEDVMAFFNEQFPNAVPLMPTLLEDYQQNPTASLVTVKCYPWIYENKSMLIGDAAHAIVPFYGQGMNCGFEDCWYFIQILDENPNAEWGEILKKYQDARKKNGDAVADLALANFIEMRDKVAEPSFLERKKIEKDLGLMFPGIFNSVYEMVSFSQTPYDTAIRSQKAQDKLLERIMNTGDFYTLRNEEPFQKQLATWMSEYQNDIAAII
jgi:kynurenine 3-monooxygenase